jgi:hypothetical protein
VCETIILRRVLRLKREAIPEVWRELHTEDLGSSYSLLLVIGVMKTMWIRWAVHKVLMLIVTYLLTSITLTPGGSSTVPYRLCLEAVIKNLHET